MSYYVSFCLAYVEFVWDPMSHHQSVCLSELCHKLKDDYSIFEGEQSKPVKVKLLFFCTADLVDSEHSGFLLEQ